MSRSFLSKSVGATGFDTKLSPSSSTPFSCITSAVYPLVNKAFDIRAYLPDVLINLFAVLARHYYVEHDEVDFSLVLQELRNCIFSVDGFNHRIAEFLEDILRQLPHLDIIFGYEYRLCPANRW